MTRQFIALLFAAAIAVSAAAQAPAKAAATAPNDTATTGTAVIDSDSHETRTAFQDVLRRYPSDVSRVLKLDPSLMTNQSYLANYPALAAFLAQHPEIAHSPAFYIGNVSFPEDGRAENSSERVWRETMEGLSIFAVLALVTGVLTWLVRTLIDHRRWSRLSKVQAEVHNKLMDRFTANDDLLAYIQTPAGKRFLESAPIALDGPRAVSAPIGRILWSVQVGLVLAAAGFGLEYVSGSIEKAVSQPLFAMGVLAIAIGAGFVLSAIVSFILSRKLGLWEPPPTPAESTPTD
jgi:ABC-type multidrug transport system fused ATPase/permease subunit